MLATLAVTASSCFNQWRQTDARHQLKPFHLLPDNGNIDWKTRYSSATRSVVCLFFLFYLKAPHGSFGLALVVSLWGSGGFPPFTSTAIGDTSFPLFCPRWWFVKKKRPECDRHVFDQSYLILDGRLIVRISEKVFQLWLFFFSFLLVFECVANMMMSPTPLFPEVMAEHNFSNFSW